MRISPRVSLCPVMGTDIACVNMKTLTSIIKERLNELSGNYICAVNVHSIVTASEDESHKRALDNSFMCIPDGAPIAAAMKRQGHVFTERTAGPDLMHEIFSESPSKGWRHFFYGSTPEVIQEMEKNIYLKYPGINIVGTHSPPFRNLSKAEDNAIIAMINALHPDFVWVGLGCPKQEWWMYQHQEKVEGLMIGVGAGFDFYAKPSKRAPKWMQKHSLEWLHRLLQNPIRLWSRYFKTNTKFLAYALKSAVSPNNTHKFP